MWRMDHAGIRTASLPGLSTRCSPTYGRSQHLRITVPLNLLGQRSLLLTSGTWGQECSGSGFHFLAVHTPHRVGSQILVLRLFHFLHAPTQNSNDLEKSTNTVIVAIFKSEKLFEDPKSYRSESLLYVPFKILKRLIYSTVQGCQTSFKKKSQTMSKKKPNGVKKPNC